MARTRAKGPAASTSKADDTKKPPASSTSSVYTLPPTSDNPSKLFILPKSVSPTTARVITLHHPRNNKPSRFLVCPESGFFEFTTVASPLRSAPRSWLVQSSSSSSSSSSSVSVSQQPETPAATDPTNPQTTTPKTEIIQSPTLHLTTPYDPLFLLLPALFANPSSSSSNDSKRMFLSLDDHLDTLPDPSRHLASLLSTTNPSSTATRQLVEARMAAVCDTVEAGGEIMYRVSEGKVVREVLGKARAVLGGPGTTLEGGKGDEKGKLPGSMEERFVRRALEAPVLGVRVDWKGAGAGGNGSGSGTATPTTTGESQESVASTETVGSSATEVSAASTAATSTSVAADGEGDNGVASAMTASEEVVHLQRLRVAFDYICARYIDPSITATLKTHLAKESTTTGLGVDFGPLDQYLAQLAKVRQEAAAERSGDFSRKRGGDEEQDERAEKRRKQEAEEKAKKASMSRGVKNLMKVNTNGMKKMSDFFKKK
ncbi:ribonuclease H2, subunit B [Dichotomopilus funicola]|uniref:Ribonuclease H2 subunit B n=1 Tax=Dichotomopilus funicola TaxID=1934379 RepID=A0AAN6ZKW3_9PEZI|nr:ribonuclease H2, subunit B [Dichotomopilus funicola]